MSSGSLAAIIDYVSLVLGCDGNLDLEGNQSLSELVKRLQGAEQEAKEKSKRLNLGDDGNSNACFDTSLTPIIDSTSTLRVDEDGARVKSTSQKNAVCLINVGLTEGQVYMHASDRVY